MFYTEIEGHLATQVFDGACWSHVPGHAPHITQIRKSLEQEGKSVFLAPQGEVGMISIAVEGEITNFYNHHAEVIYNLEQLHATSVCLLVERFGTLLMKIKAGEGYAFSISEWPISGCVN